MKITQIQIEKFRGFKNISFQTGKQLTVIAGLNGTQKTTILGILSQPFSITDLANPMINESPLCGGNFKSAFSDKFRLSDVHDKIGEHEWTLNFDDTTSFTVESIPRNKTNIRFWQKGNRSKGSGYIQLPVIYLSLKRLMPIGEDGLLKVNASLSLTSDEIALYAKWHNEILIITRPQDEITHSNLLISKDKQTLGVNTSYYDWQTNSAGQDNLGKILLAILSFKRLKETYGSDYKGGILAIDEIDTTLYPGSQLKLIEKFIRFAADYDIQIFVTTHSLTILERVSELMSHPSRINDIKLIYLKREDTNVNAIPNADFSFIKNHLNRVVTGQIKNPKIDVYVEDKEAQHFLKNLLGNGITKNLKFVDISLGCGQFIELASRKVPSFTFPNSIIVLDGDTRKKIPEMRKISKIKNIILLPTDKSPEQILSDFLNNLPDTHPLWQEIDVTFDHGICFGTYSNLDIQNGKGSKKPRDVAKEWYNSYISLWGPNAGKVWKYWKLANQDTVNEFKSNFQTFIEKFKI